MPRSLRPLVALAAALLVAATLLVASPARAELGTQVRGPVAAASLAFGDGQVCTVGFDGLLRCWGLNNAGQLGYGNTTNVGTDVLPVTPTRTVPLGAGRTVRSVSAGDDSTCAVLDTGSVRCWGNNESGNLGLGSTTDLGDNEAITSAPAVPLGAGRTARAVAVGESHTCAILDTGAVRCWGQGAVGALGNGSSADIGDDEPASAGPTVDLGGRTARAITAGSGHTCAILDNGAVRCWGFNGFGEIGLGQGTGYHLGDNEPVASRPTIDLGPGRTATAIAAGGNHTCAVLDDGTLRCWGRNDHGTLGLGAVGNVGDNESPSALPPVYLGPGRTAVAVDTGEKNTCVLLDDATVRCWGDNTWGQLPTNAPVVGDDELPVLPPVALGRPVRAVSVGTEAICVTRDDARAYCWGRGASGRLGNGTIDTIGDDELPTARGPVPVGLVRLDAGRGALTAAATPARDRTRPYKYVLTGRLSGSALPGACAGRVAVQVGGTVRVAGTRKRVAVRAQGTASLVPAGSACAYRVAVKVTPAQRKWARKKLAGPVVASVRFGGSAYLTSASAAVRIRLG